MRTNKPKTILVSDIHSGYVVKLRCGKTMTCMRVGSFTKILCTPDGYWSYMSNWDDALKGKANSISNSYKNPHMYIQPNTRDYDIMEVYGLLSGTDCYCGVMSNNIANRPLLWKRVEAVRMTLRQLEEKLGCEIELVSEEVAE